MSFSSSSSYNYFDDDGISRGPFEFSQLADWWRLDYFPPEMKFYPTDDSAAVSAIELFCSSVDYFYLDDSGISQGPFPFSSLVEWFRGGFFDGSTKVRRATEEKFSEISSHSDWKFLFPSSLKYFVSFSFSSPFVGPFSTAQLRLWFAKGFIESPSVRFRTDEQNDSDARSLTEISFSDYPDFVRLSASVAPFAHLTQLNEYWRFKDFNGEIRGPFSTSQMRFWHSSGYFPESNNFLVQRIDPRSGLADAEFKPMKSRFCSFLLEAPKWENSTNNQSSINEIERIEAKKEISEENQNFKSSNEEILSVK